MSVDGVRLLGSQYRLSAQIGRGGMGEVWRGVDAQGRPRAFKLLLPHYAQDAEVVRRFLAERQVLTSVRDPNVVGVHDLVIEGSTLGIVMDLVEGQDLRHYLRERGTLPSGVACRIGAQVASGLAAIHAVRIVHRDVKPENILLDLRADPPQARLTDFGVAKVLEETSVPTPTVVAGTPCYMAPEVINGQIPSTRSDLYSLGIVLYEMLCGVAPFVGLANGPMMQAHLTMDPGRPDGIDDRVWSLISQLVSKVAGQRPPDAGLVAAQLWSLAELTGGVPALPRLASPPPPVRAVAPAAVVAETQLAPPASPPPPPGMRMTPMPVAYVAAPPKNWTPALVGAIIGLLVVLAGVVGYLILGGRPATDDGPAIGKTESVSPSVTQTSRPEPSPATESVAIPTASVPGTAYFAYTNPRFGYSFQVPAEFVPGEPWRTGPARPGHRSTGR